MDIKATLTDKQQKPQEKTQLLSQALLDNTITLSELLELAAVSKDAEKGTCIEVIEYATKLKPDIATIECLNFMASALTHKAPRVKWESAKVIGNIAHLYPTQLDEAITQLLVNSEYTGTVVRWSAAFALGEIIKLKTAHNTDLIPAIESICDREEKNSIKKIYMAALKKISK